MTVHRFYAPGMTAGMPRVVLDPDESAHLTRVLRLKPGAAVRVFDGRGLEREARVVTARAKASELDLTGEVVARPEGRVRIHLGMALLKADRFDAAIRDAVMLGVSSLQPLTTDRSDVPAAAVSSGARLTRWERIAVASAKQCGRAVVPRVHDPVSLAGCLDRDPSPLRLLFAEPSVTETERLAAGASALPDVTAALVLVGPEGGWSPREVEVARAAQCRVVTLGPRTLRADAAPIVALTVLQFLWGDL